MKCTISVSYREYHKGVNLPFRIEFSNGQSFRLDLKDPPKEAFIPRSNEGLFTYTNAVSFTPAFNYLWFRYELVIESELYFTIVAKQPIHTQVRLA